MDNTGKLVYPKTNEKITIACVLKTGGKVYNSTYVNNLAAGVKRNITIPYEFVCLTDIPTNYSTIDRNVVHRVIPLINSFPNWWSKIELFRENIFTTNTVVYFDLDTLIIGNIDYLQSFNENFGALLDFNAFNTPNLLSKTSIGSGVMCWSNNYPTKLYNIFIQDSKKYMDYMSGGDQQFIENIIGLSNIYFLQDEFPKEIISYKVHTPYRHKPYDESIVSKLNPSIVCFHGSPRIHDVDNDFVKKHWHKL